MIYDNRGYRKYLTADERQAFVNAAKLLKPEVRTFCLTLAYTGARISEVLALTAERVDLGTQMIVLESLKKRRRGVYRAVPVPLDLLNDLAQAHSLQYLQEGDGTRSHRLWPWCRTTAWNNVKLCMMNAEISGPWATAKGLRHSFGVNALQAGVPLNLLKRWLGHARMSTTEIYAEAVGPEEHAMAARLWTTF